MHTHIQAYVLKLKMSLYKFVYENFHMFDDSHASVGLLFKDNKILLLKRSPESKSYANCFCFPGGHKDSGETNISTLIREFKEETGINVSVDNFLCRFKTPKNYCNVYFVSANNFNVKLSFEHTEYVWFDLADNINLPMGHQTRKVLTYLKSIQ